MQSVIKDPQLSLVIPMFNEAGNIAPLLAETAAAFDGLSYEIIVVDDASEDGGSDEIAQGTTSARVLTHQRAARGERDRARQAQSGPPTNPLDNRCMHR